MKSLKFSLKINYFREIRFLFFFLFAISLTGFFDNFITSLNHPLSSTLNFIRLTVILYCLLIFYLLKNEKFEN